jgi:hypothetical protein
MTGKFSMIAMMVHLQSLFMIFAWLAPNLFAARAKKDE